MLASIIMRFNDILVHTSLNDLASRNQQIKIHHSSIIKLNVSGALALQKL